MVTQDSHKSGAFSKLDFGNTEWYFLKILSATCSTGLQITFGHKNFEHTLLLQHEIRAQSLLLPFLELWNFTLKNHEFLSSFIKNMLYWSPQNIWAHPLPFFNSALEHKVDYLALQRNVELYSMDFHLLHVKIRVQNEVCLNLATGGVTFW